MFLRIFQIFVLLFGHTQSLPAVVSSHSEEDVLISFNWRRRFEQNLEINTSSVRQYSTRHYSATQYHGIQYHGIQYQSDALCHNNILIPIKCNVLPCNSLHAMHYNTIWHTQMQKNWAIYTNAKHYTISACTARYYAIYYYICCNLIWQYAS